MLAYRGTITTTGTSEAMRFDKALFRQHPEFRQKAKVEAHVIGQGTLLVHVTDEQAAEQQEDPMVMAYLAFLERDATENPNRITPLSGGLIERAVEATKNVAVSDDDKIPDDVSV
jgi:antitoxin PrlF